MIFEFESNDKVSMLRAHFEPDDSYTGSRQEGNFQAITYSGADITFGYGVRSIHPDLLGLLCLIIFYPFIGYRVVFPMPVSRRLEHAFQKPSFTRRFRFDNVDPLLDGYAGSKIALSFGGGIDSTAVRVMFPEAFIVHEAHLKDGRVAPSFSHGVVRDLGAERAALITSNQRYVSQPGGWHGWTCAFATSLLLATDHDFGIILMGTTISSTLLSGGAGYWDRFKARSWHGVTGNYWQSAFNEIGLPVFSPVCGMSGYMTMKLSLDLIQQGDVFYCAAKEGTACFRCTKCLRRDLIRAVVDPAHRPDWAPYDREDVHEFLERQPLYCGHIFAYARNRIPDLPLFLASRLQVLPAIASNWPMRVYVRTFDLCDSGWREEIRDRVLARVKPMKRRHLRAVKKWDIRPPGERAGSAWRRILGDRT